MKCIGRADGAEAEVGYRGDGEEIGNDFRLGNNEKSLGYGIVPDAEFIGDAGMARLVHPSASLWE